MTLIDKEEITVGDYNTAKVLNASFSNIASNLYPFATMGVVKGATKSSREIIFLSTTKIGENAANILNCYISN